MKQNTPEYQAEAARIYNAMRGTLRDETHTNPENPKLPVHIRAGSFLQNEESIQRETGLRAVLWELYDDALKMVAVDLKQGYVDGHPVETMDHQAREWLLARLEKIVDGEHPFRTHLKSNPDFAAIFTFGYAGITTPTGVPLLPMAMVQLVDYTSEEGEIIETDGWDVQTNGIYIDPEALKQYGR